ncbi:MAG: adenylate/guanylate cyclase domain-containing protein [Dehalococcoidia bacterium]
MAEFVVIVARPGTQERYSKTFEAPIVVGRSPDCDIQLADAEVSRRHAEFSVGGSTITIRDLNSTNGCVVQGAKLQDAEVVVENSALVLIGPFVLSLSVAGAAGATTTQLAASGGESTLTGGAAQGPAEDRTSPSIPAGTQTVMFSDIDDSTLLTAQLGDRRWMVVLHEHNAIVRRCIAQHSGYEVKTAGDEFMVSFQSAIDAVQCAIAIQGALTVRNAEAEVRIDVQIGLHTGEPVVEDGDLFGGHINFAARIAGQAEGGEIVISELLRQLIEPSGAFRLSAREPVALKGLEGTHRLHDVEWEGADRDGVADGAGG